MEKRRARRFGTDQPVVVTLMDQPDGKPGLRLPARVSDASRGGVRLEANGPIDCGTEIRIEFEDSLITGTVVHCEGKNGRFFLGIQMKEAACGEGDLLWRLRGFSRRHFGPSRRRTGPDAEPGKLYPL